MRFLSLFLALILAVSLAACGSQTSGAPPLGEPVAGTPVDSELASDGPASDGPANSAPSAFPVTVTDQLGRTVTLVQPPETIVTSYYISTSLLLALGLQNNLVGVETKPENRPLYRLGAPQVLDLPNVGTAKELDLEVCAALEPDLIVLPARLRDTIPALEELGFTVIAVDPEDEPLLQEAITLLGVATGAADRAAALLAFRAEQLQPLAAALAGAPAPTVYLASNSALLATAGPAMYQNALIEQAGGANVAAGLSEDYWAEISYEQLLAWNPEYIILAADAKYTVDDVLQDENLQACAAVQNGHVYQLPNGVESWDSPVPGSFLGCLWLAAVLHPDRYPAENWQQAVTAYYESFYGFTPDVENLYA